MANFNEHSLEMSIMELFQDEGYVYLNGEPVSYTHLRAHETRHDLVCRLLLEKKKKNPRPRDGLRERKNE